MARPADAYPLNGQRWASKHSFRRWLSDLLDKSWMEGAVPLVLAVILGLSFALTTPAIVSPGDMSVMAGRLAELGLLAIALTLVLLAGGIDLSIGAMAGLTSIAALVMFRVYEMPGAVVVPITLAFGAILGAVNGFFIAVVKTRPFITTLVTAITFRALLQVVQSAYSAGLTFPRVDLTWAFLGRGAIAMIPTGILILLVVLVVVHVMLNRSRWGWWLKAVGSDRRSARRNGIPVQRVTFLAYVACGVLCALTGALMAARQGSTSASLGAGYEIIALTAVVLGGVSLRGGRGSVVRALIGTVVVVVIGQSIFRLNGETAVEVMVLAGVLLIFAAIDEKWGLHRAGLAQKLAINPFHYRAGPLVDVTDPSTVWRANKELDDAEPIGLGLIEGPEDCVVDDAERVYCGDRRGWIWRISGEGYRDAQIFARTGGTPLGHVWDQHGNLVVCVGGIGVARIDPTGDLEWIATHAKRRRFQLHDDTAIRFADDLDVAPDGSIYFSDASSRISAGNLLQMAAEYRPDGRVLRIDPDGSVDTVATSFASANGICTSHDGQSILIASTLFFRVDRLWISGPKQGQIEPVIENMPALPDNINRASDGNYWMSFTALRTPFLDIFLRHPEYRRAMTKQLPLDEWVLPQQNLSCVAKFTEAGDIIKIMWDSTASKHPLVTSMSEHRGWLYIGGLQNNRVGRVRLDPSEIGPIDPYAIPGLGRPVLPGTADIVVPDGVRG
jgi:ribose transport system permease protein